MKRFVSYFLVVALFCIGFVFTAYMAAGDPVEGLTFNQNTFYKLEDDFAGQPVTVEAWIYFNKRADLKESGSFFGNWRGAENTSNIQFSVDKSGHPYIVWKEYSDSGEYTTHIQHTYTFEKTSVKKSEWVHLTMVRDEAANEYRCYINGELSETLTVPDGEWDVPLWDFVLGGDMTTLNMNYFKGRLKSLAVYSDVRTEKEIKADMEKVGTSDLVLHYDLSGNTEATPAKAVDNSKNKNDAIYFKRPCGCKSAQGR